MKKKLKPPFKFEIGKCYRVRAFESQCLYRVKVNKIWENDGAPHGDYRTCYGTYYSPIDHEGSFDLITEAIEIPSL